MRGNEGGVRGRVESLARELAPQSASALLVVSMGRIQAAEIEDVGMAVRRTDDLALRR